MLSASLTRHNHVYKGRSGSQCSPGFAKQFTFYLKIKIIKFIPFACRFGPNFASERVVQKHSEHERSILVAIGLACYAYGKHEGDLASLPTDCTWCRHRKCGACATHSGPFLFSSGYAASHLKTPTRVPQENRESNPNL